MIFAFTIKKKPVKRYFVKIICNIEVISWALSTKNIKKLINCINHTAWNGRHEQKTKKKKANKNKRGNRTTIENSNYTFACSYQQQNKKDEIKFVFEFTIIIVRIIGKTRLFFKENLQKRGNFNTRKEFYKKCNCNHSCYMEHSKSYSSHSVFK